MFKYISKLIAFLVLVSCAGLARADEVTVAAAANVQFVLQDLAAAFKAKTGVDVKPVIASSGKLATQIENGAPFDIFMSADTDFPARLKKEGLTSGEPKVYALGTLVLWSTTGIDLTLGMNALTDVRVKKVAIPTPKTAPYGKQGVNALKKAGLYEQVQPKLVYGESISQTNQFIVSGAAEAGFTAKSIVLAKDMQGKGTWVEVPQDLYEPISQAAVLLKKADSDAESFFAFLYSAEGQEILKKYGYIIP